MDFKNYNTYKEIIMQPESWESALKDIVDNNLTVPGILKTAYDHVIFFGCGSSYNLGQSASFFYRYLSGNTNSLALPSSELLINPGLYISENKKYLLVGFSRSGETTESLKVIEQMQVKKNISILTFTCKDKSSFSKISINNFLCRNAVEKSIVMTTSFSSMLLAFCSALAVAEGNKIIINDFKKLIELTHLNQDTIVDFVDNFIQKVEFNSYFALGSGFNYGLAVEADLKMKEMSQVPSYSYHIHEFSHGPKSLLTDESLCIVLTPSKNMFKYEQSLKEFVQLGTNMLIIGSQPVVDIEVSSLYHKIHIFFGEDSFQKYNLQNENIKSFINIPVFQLMAFFNTLKNKLNPDIPNNLSYTVKI